MRGLQLIICGLFLTLTTSSIAQVALSKDQKKLVELMMLIQGRYVDTVNEAELTDFAIRKTLERLDPHSSYTPKKNVARANESLKGSFDGIGVQFRIMKDTVLIVAVISGGPSEKVGILAGDKIVDVDEQPFVGDSINNNKVMKTLRGKKGTKVDVRIKRGDDPELLDFTITRGKIPIFSVDAAYMIDENIGYIKINRFSATTMKEFTQAKRKLDSMGMTQLILDLQGNSGGYLNTAHQLVDQFLDGKKLVVYTQGEHTPRRELKSTNSGAFEVGQMVVLIDGGSASASEITSGAIQDWDRGVVIGRRTFGKGLVQNQFNLSDGSEIKLTTSKYYIPSGRCIQRPYEGMSKKEYRSEWQRRLDSGEMFSGDSISFPDSLIFKTAGGRDVYGGGGVMPDVYVPLDTSGQSDYYKTLFRKGIFNDFVLNYTNDNRDELKQKYPNEYVFKKSFVLTDDLLESLFKAADEKKIERVQADIDESMSLIKSNFTALIARNLYGQNGFYYIWNDQNEIVQKGVEILKDQKMYKKILKGN